MIGFSHDSKSRNIRSVKVGLKLFLNFLFFNTAWLECLHYTVIPIFNMQK